MEQFDPGNFSEPIDDIAEDAFYRMKAMYDEEACDKHIDDSSVCTMPVQRGSSSYFKSTTITKACIMNEIDDALALAVDLPAHMSALITRSAMVLDRHSRHDFQIGMTAFAPPESVVAGEVRLRWFMTAHERTLGERAELIWSELGRYGVGMLVLERGDSAWGLYLESRVAKVYMPSKDEDPENPDVTIVD